MNAELDTLIDRYRTTIPFGPRMDAARQITRNVTENLPLLPLFFDSWPGVVVPKLVNVDVSANGGQATWNVNQWDIR
jgi:ABC-type transport system substrate-binding protein